MPLISFPSLLLLLFYFSLDFERIMLIPHEYVHLIVASSVCYKMYLETTQARMVATSGESIRIVPVLRCQLAQFIASS